MAEEEQPKRPMKALRQEMQRAWLAEQGDTTWAAPSSQLTTGGYLLNVSQANTPAIYSNVAQVLSNRT